MRNGDVIAGVLTLAVGLGAAVAAAKMPGAHGQAIGPGAFPLVIGVGLAVGGTILLATSVRSRRVAGPPAEPGPSRRRSARNVLLVAGGIAVYALALESAGFFVVAPLFLAVLFRAFGVRWRVLVPAALGLTLALHVVFYSLLRVPLPWGWLEAVAW